MLSVFISVNDTDVPGKQARHVVLWLLIHCGLAYFLMDSFSLSRHYLF